MTALSPPPNAESAGLLSKLAGPVLVVGPAFSGKSRIAQQIMGPIEPTTVLGTSTVESPLIAKRVKALHQLRPGGWSVVSGVTDLTAAASHALQQGHHLLIDSLSQWLAGEVVGAGHLISSNEIETIETLEAKTNELLQTLKSATDQRIVVVSAEMGAGPAPHNHAERILRMILGDANCALASFARTVIDVRCGIPRVIKTP